MKIQVAYRRMQSKRRMRLFKRQIMLPSLTFSYSICYCKSHFANGDICANYYSVGEFFDQYRQSEQKVFTTSVLSVSK